jgi:chromatin structure-remodeling complex subunit RSC1/2
MPRPYEVYRFMDPATEAGIPPEIRSQFQRDDQGRLLWFTSAARDRSANKGVAPEYAHLGHSISHLANIGNIRAERRRKRKERDEALEKEADANKRACTERETSGAEESARAKQAMLVQVLTEFSEEMERGTRLIEEDIAGFREEKAAWDEERKAMKVTEVAKKSAAKEQADEVVED